MGDVVSLGGAVAGVITDWLESGLVTGLVGAAQVLDADAVPAIVFFAMDDQGFTTSLGLTDYLRLSVQAEASVCMMAAAAEAEDG